MRKNARPRLLVLTSTYPRWPGDATPRFVADLAGGMARADMDVTVLAPASHGAAACDREGDVAVRRFRYGWPASTQRLADGAILPNIRRNRWLAAQAAPFSLAQLAAACRLARNGDFDLVHAHWAVPQGFIGAMLKRAFGVRLLTTTHGADLYALRSGPAMHAKRWALQSSDAVTAVSGALKREAVALGIDESRVHVLPMGVDTARFTPDAASPALRRRLSPDGPLLLFVGRLAEKKGVRYAIEAMPAILREQPAACLVIIGDGPDRDALLALRDRLGLRAAVQFLGAVPNEDLPAYYATTDIFVGPSVVARDGDTESFGVVFAEAMASGCPVIATDVGGVADVVVDGVTGTLVPERDSAAIARAACHLLRDEARREAMRERASQSVRERFDHAVIHRAYADIVEELTAA